MPRKRKKASEEVIENETWRNAGIAGEVAFRAPTLTVLDLGEVGVVDYKVRTH